MIKIESNTIEINQMQQKIGNKSPGKDKESNWLPAPAGEFSIWLRAYWPDQPILDGTWTPPTVTRVPKGDNVQAK
jgi:hypothetical protein